MVGSTTQHHDALVIKVQIMFLKGQLGLSDTFLCILTIHKVSGTHLPMVGAVQIVGHGRILCCQGVNLIGDRIVILSSVC